jgi:hypothetical protein
VGWAGQACWFTGLPAATLLQKLSDAGTLLLPVQTTDRVWKPLPQETEQPLHGDET